jgi:hypothetical protein
MESILEHPKEVLGSFLEISSNYSEQLLTIDESLGSKKRRYLGEGYKKTNYEFKDITPEDGVKNKLKIQASVIYPDDWSLKAEGKRKDTHLSTIDILVLSNRICESIFLLKNKNIEAVNSTWLQKIDMKLGNQPVDQLEDISFSIEYLGATALDINCSHFQMSIGNAKADLYYSHLSPQSFFNLYEMDFYKLLKIAQIETGKPFGNLFKRRDIHINSAVLCREDSEITANINVVQESLETISHGVNAANLRSLNVLDLMLAGAQMSQVLIYKLDNVHRDQTKNLWARSFSAFALPCTDSMDVNAIASVPKTVVLKKGGKLFRIADCNVKIAGYPYLGIRGSFVLEKE